MAGLGTDYQLGQVGDHATDLLETISPVVSCDDRTGPTDELQNPVKVGHIMCGVGRSDLHIFAYEEPAGIPYQVQTVELGSGAGRGFLLGSDWLIVAEPEILSRVAPLVGGEIHTSEQAALRGREGYTESDAFVMCYQFLTGTVVEYVASGENHLSELDEYTIPGVEEKFDEALDGVVPSLASYEKQDISEATRDLIPYAEEMRDICRDLHPR